MPTEPSVLKINTNLIIPNKYQPRKVFDDIALNSLAESIKNYGIINPILVRKKDDKYEIIAGERRFRAAQKVGLTEVPVIVKTADEQQMAELALIENIQRQGLSPIEEAKSYEEIMRIGNQTQSSLAAKLGKSQSAIANKIRLLVLPQEIQNALANKQISERHARSLINVENKEKQLELLNKIIKEKLTVKETEQIINEKEISEEEIKQAISDIMKSLNIKEEEKEDDNMNNGNFFPNFDNNNAANNNTSLNMMNMQSMNQMPQQPEPEMVMPTPVIQPQPLTPNINSISVNQDQPINQFGTLPVSNPIPNINNVLPTNESFISPQPFAPQENMMSQTTPTISNDVPVFGPQAEVTSPIVEPQIQTPVNTNMMEDVPLFNPTVVMPTIEPQLSPMPEVAPQMSVSEPQIINQNSFEIPLSPIETITTTTVDRLNELQNLLTSNGYNYKVYSNETDNCVIIELPKN